MIDKEKSLAYRFPELAKEWDYEGNASLNPNDISYGSTQKVSWKCSKCGGKYITSVNQRTNSHSGCPYCSNHKVLQGFNDLATRHPDLAIEWDYRRNGDLRPENVLCSSHKKVYWICPVCCNSYDAWIFNRTKGESCPYCAGRKVKVGFNDLASNYPELLKEWDYDVNSHLSPYDITTRSNRVIGWKCSVCAHKWKTAIVKRTMGAQCPKCNKRNHTSFPEQAIFYYIKKVYPEAINGFKGVFDRSMELDIYIPTIQVAIEYDGIQWHTDKESLREQKKYQICRENGIKLIRVREDETQNSYCDVSISCQYRHRDYSYLDETIKNVFVALGVPCPSVNTKNDAIEINSAFLTVIRNGSFGEMFPQYIDEWDNEKNGDLTPFMFSPYSNEKVSWICRACGHKYEMIIGSKAQGRKCIKCSYVSRGEKQSERNKKRVRNIDTGVEFNSISEAAIYYGGDPKKNHIGECCNGKAKTALGYRWEFV